MGESAMGKIIDARPNELLISVPFDRWEMFCHRKLEDVEVILHDGRQLSAKQRNAIILTVSDIAEAVSGYAHKKNIFQETMACLQWLYLYDLMECADDPEYREMVRYRLTRCYCRMTETPFFSLSPKIENCADMTTAREFLGFLLDFCIQEAIPCRESLLTRAEDVGRYMYSCLAHKRCAICGKKADLHHVDCVGMGRNREEILHKGMRAESLCREHHTQAHVIGHATFDEKYHIYGIELDDNLCEIHGLKH